MSAELKNQLITFLKELQRAQVKSFHEWDIKSESMPAICEFMQDTNYLLERIQEEQA